MMTKVVRILCQKLKILHVQILCTFSSRFSHSNYQWHCGMTLFATLMTLVYLLSSTCTVVLYCVHFYVFFTLFGVALFYYFCSEMLRAGCGTGQCQTKSNTAE